MYKYLLIFAITLWTQAYGAQILSGPMLTGLEMREARIWVQTDTPSLVRVKYTDDAGKGESIWSMPIETDPSLASTGTVLLSKVKPGVAYRYQIELNGELLEETYEFTSPAFYHGRTPPPDFRIAVGGAHYRSEEGFEPPYQILGGDYDIFEAIAEADPALMLWLGNTAHLRESDWASQSGYLKRYTEARSTPELQNLLSGTPHYATWGAADYGPDGAGSHYSHRHIAETSFKAFWPRPVEIRQLEGIATCFRYADVDFFLLDTYSQRNETPSSGDPYEILGDEQIEWLRQELVRSTATFKVIAAGNPILNPVKMPGNLRYAESEHTKLTQMLRSEKIPGLFFISGGKYYGQLTRIAHGPSYYLFDLTVGPLTANPQEETGDDHNFFSRPGTNTSERQFALIDFTGPEEDRRMVIRVMNPEGKELWTREISASTLQPTSEGTGF